MRKIFPAAGDGPTLCSSTVSAYPPEGESDDCFGGLEAVCLATEILPATEIKNHMATDKQLQIVTTKVLPLHRPRHEWNAYACSV
jgi:hypothetical protein